MAIYITVDEDHNTATWIKPPQDIMQAIESGSWCGTLLRLDINDGVTEYLCHYPRNEHETAYVTWFPVASGTYNEPPAE